MSKNLKYKQVVTVKRREWDLEAYEARAKARAEAESQAASSGPHANKNRKGGTEERVHVDANANEEDKEEFRPAEPGRAGPAGSQRAFLQPRRGKVDISSKIGETEIISAEAAAKTSLKEEGISSKDGVTKSGVGWHCSVCDCFLKDSMTYLDHINGRKHQRKLGYSMRVERSTKDQMMGRLSQLAQAKEQREKKSQISQLEEEEAPNFHEAVKAKDEEEARKREEKAKRRKEKKKQKQLAAEAPPEEPEGEEEGDEVEAEGINPELAAMMGFSGFK